MTMSQQKNDIQPCVCGGGIPKVKYFSPYTWITCNKCRRTTQVYSDSLHKQDGLDKAIAEWNDILKEAKNA